MVGQFEEHCKPVEETAFWAPFATGQFAKIVTSPDEQGSLREKAKKAIEYSVKPGMSKLAEFLKTKYLPKTRSNIEATSLPNGEEFYKACLKFHTSTNLTAQEIHDIGVKEVERIEANMRSVIKELGLNKSIKDFGELLRQDPKFQFNSPQEQLNAFESMCKDNINPKLRQLFWSPPDLEYV